MLNDLLQDVKTLKLTPNTAPASSNSSDSTERAQFVCSLTLKEMNGSQPFIYISTCGCVFSQAGFKTITASSSPKDKEQADEPTVELCPQCAKKYSKDDIIPLNPSQDEEDTMRFALERKRLTETTTKKKSKKRKNDLPADESEPPTKKQAAAPAPSINPAMATTSRAVTSQLAMEEAKRKATMSDAVKSLYGDGTTKKETFMTMGTFTRVSLFTYLHLSLFTDWLV